MSATSVQAELDFVTPPWPKISAAAKDCVRQLLTVQVQSRPSAYELLQVLILTRSMLNLRCCLYADTDLQQLWMTYKGSCLIGGMHHPL